MFHSDTCQIFEYPGMNLTWPHRLTGNQLEQPIQPKFGPWLGVSHSCSHGCPAQGLGSPKAHRQCCQGKASIKHHCLDFVPI